MLPTWFSDQHKVLLSGGLAGTCAKTATAPLSRVTILFQVHSMVTTNKGQPNFAEGTLGAFSKILQREGVAALWRGNLTSVLHRFPYTAVNFWVFERLKAHLSGGRDADASPLHRLGAGAAAGAVACTACYPLELVRTRPTAQVARPPGAKPFAHRPRLERHWTIGVQSCRYSHHVTLSNVSSLISPRPPCIFDLGDVQVTS